MCLAAYIRTLAEVKIIDEVAGQNVEKELLSFQPDWVGVTVQTPCAYRAYDIADFAKEHLDCKVALGGHHATARAREALQHADHVVLNEGEKVLKGLITGDITEPIIHGVPLRDLDAVPSLPWDAINFEFYVQTKHNQPYAPFPLDNPRAMSIITSRGCPRRCIFCWNSLRATPVRFNSAERVCFEVDQLMNRGINSIHFNDDDFLTNRKRLPTMFQHFRKVGLVWGCQATASTITEKIAEMLARSNCAYVGMGLEHGNPRILNILKAGSVTVEQNKKAIQVLKKYGIPIIGSFIFGTPSETSEEMKDTVNFIIEQPLDSVVINSLTAYPATTLWKMVEEKLKGVDYSTLVPSSGPQNEAILCDTMSKDGFKKFLKDVVAITIFKRGLRFARLQNRSWLRLFFRHPFYPYFLVRHPFTAARIIRRAR